MYGLLRALKGDGIYNVLLSMCNIWQGYTGIRQWMINKCTYIPKDDKQNYPLSGTRE